MMKHVKEKACATCKGVFPPDNFKINLPTYNGDDSWTLPMPTRFIVDTSMRIRYIQTDPDYTVRPEPLHTLGALKQIVKGGRP